MKFLDIRPVSCEDYRFKAKRKLPRFLFDYIDGGANNEQTMAANVSDFNRYNLKQRVMRDVSNIDTSTTLAGQTVSMPIVLAPVGMAGMFARRGEVQGAEAASITNIPFAASTAGICPLEEVATACQQPLWFQLYMMRDRDFVLKLLERAQAINCTTLVFTVDLPIAGMRLRDFRNGMMGGGMNGAISRFMQLAASPQWLIDVGIKGKPHNFGNLREAVTDPNDLDSYKTFIDEQFDPTVTWEDIAWLRSQWPGKILIKGIMEPDDALAARDVGADGLIVSNHGGRQLDGTASSISKLAAIAQIVGDDMEVFMDGGIRSGIDVVKALALGARGVLIGRPWVWAIAASGRAGLVNLLDTFQQEIATAMALQGVTKVSDINTELIEPG